jgi:hypothetical protein
MDETRATASLPGLDIEMKRRVDADEGAEYVSITMRAVPSFEAFASALPPLVNPFALPLALWQGWADMVQAAWQPFLAAAGEPPRLSKRS